MATGLTRFPQYSGVQNDSPGLGNSTYHSLQLTARKNSTHGLTFIAAYTLSKNISDSASAMRYYNVYIQDLYNRKLEKSHCVFRLPASPEIDLDLRAALRPRPEVVEFVRLGDRIFSGWQFTAIQRYGSGDTLNIGSSLSSYITPTVRADVVKGAAPTVPLKGLDIVNGTPLLNPSAFADPPATLSESGYALRPGTASVYLPNVRGPAHQAEDFGLIKDTPITERVKLKLPARL